MSAARSSPLLRASKAVLGHNAAGPDLSGTACRRNVPLLGGAPRTSIGRALRASTLREEMPTIAVRSSFSMRGRASAGRSLRRRRGAGTRLADGAERASTRPWPIPVNEVRRRESRQRKMTLEPVNGEGLEALIRKIYATPKPIVERVANVIK